MTPASRIAGCVVAFVLVAAFSVQRVHAQAAHAKKKAARHAAPAASTGNALDFRMKDIDGTEVDLRKYLGKVVMIVNVASKCGYTQQYEALEALYEKHKGDGFVILAFPCNDFNGQEPGDAATIKKFCSETYHVSFPLFEKIKCREPKEACGLYKFLTDTKTNSSYAGPIQWNFTKFLVDRDGHVRARFESKVKPEGKKITNMVETLLKEKTAKAPKTAARKKPAAVQKKGS